MTAGQFAQARPDRSGRGDILIEEVLRERPPVERAADLGMRRHGFRLRAEREPSAGQFGVEERLLAHAVAGEHEEGSLLIPQTQCEHAVEPLDERRAFLLVEMHEGFGVARRSVDVAFCYQFGPQGGIVVEFAVVGDPDRIVLVGHGLGAAVHVDDRQATMAQGHVAGDVKAVAVGAAMGDRGRHAFRNAPVGGPALAIHESRNSAHELTGLPAGKRCQTPFLPIGKRCLTPFLQRSSGDSPRAREPVPADFRVEPRWRFRFAEGSASIIDLRAETA